MAAKPMGFTFPIKGKKPKKGMKASPSKAMPMKAMPSKAGPQPFPPFKKG